MMLCVDPGIRGSGAAIFNESTKALVAAAYVKNPCKTGIDLEAQFDMVKAILEWAKVRGLPFSHYPTLVVEWMRLYPGQYDKGDPNKSLTPLIGVVAALSGARAWGDRKAYYPSEWKGTLNGYVMTRRIRLALTAVETSLLEPCPDGLAHNREDAVGIGLKFTGRLERRRVYTR